MLFSDASQWTVPFSPLRRTATLSAITAPTSSTRPAGSAATPASNSRAQGSASACPMDSGVERSPDACPKPAATSDRRDTERKPAHLRTPPPPWRCPGRGCSPLTRFANSAVTRDTGWLDPGEEPASLWPCGLACPPIANVSRFLSSLIVVCGQEV